MKFDWCQIDQITEPCGKVIKINNYKTVGYYHEELQKFITYKELRLLNDYEKIRRTRYDK